MSKTVPASAELLAERLAAEIIETVRRNSRVVVPKKVSGTEPDEIYPPWSNEEKT